MAELSGKNTITPGAQSDMSDLMTSVAKKEKKKR